MPRGRYDSIHCLVIVSVNSLSGPSDRNTSACQIDYWHQCWIGCRVLPSPDMWLLRPATRCDVKDVVNYIKHTLMHDDHGLCGVVLHLGLNRAGEGLTL